MTVSVKMFTSSDCSSRQARLNTSKGFTIVELLIVIVVIGILAAISIVAYNGIQNRANNISVEQDLASLVKKLELFKVDNSRYPITSAELNSLDFKASKGSYYTNSTGSAHTHNLVPCIRGGGDEYTVAAISTSGKKYYISNGSRVQEYTGTNAWSSYSTMCTTTLSSSSVISGGAGFATSTWRSWAG